MRRFSRNVPRLSGVAESTRAYSADDLVLSVTTGTRQEERTRMQLGPTEGEYIQVTGEFEKREAIEFCVQDLNNKNMEFGVCEQDGKFFVARVIVPDEEIDTRSKIVTVRSDRVDIHGNPRGIIRKGVYNFVEWYADGEVTGQAAAV